jgi:hypothetical protein
MVKITFRTGSKFLFQCLLRHGQGVAWRLRVFHLCCWWSVFVLFMDRYIYIYIHFCTTNPARSIGACFVRGFRFVLLSTLFLINQLFC